MRRFRYVLFMGPHTVPGGRRARARTVTSAAAVAAGLAIALTACGPGPEGARHPAGEAPDSRRAHRLSITIWHGSVPPDLPRRIKAELGLDVRLSVHDGDEAAVAKIVRRPAAAAGPRTRATGPGGSGVDVAFVSGEYAQALHRAGLLEPLRPELIPNLGNLHPEAAWLPHDRGNRFSVPYIWGTTGICYRADLVPRRPASWNDLLDPPRWARGGVTMMTPARRLALPALKALRHSINTTDDRPLGAAERRLLAAKRTLLGYDDATAGARVARGEAVLAQTPDGGCPTGEPGVRFTVPDEGSDLWTVVMVIPRGSRATEAAHAFVNHMLTADIHAWVPEHTGYKVPNRPAMERALAAGAGTRPQLRMTPADLLLHEPVVDLGPHAGKYDRLAARVAQG